MAELGAVRYARSAETVALLTTRTLGFFDAFEPLLADQPTEVRAAWQQAKANVAVGNLNILDALYEGIARVQAETPPSWPIP